MKKDKTKKEIIDANVKFKKSKKWSMVGMEELINIKVLKMQGLSDGTIAEMLGRSKGTIRKKVKVMDKVIPLNEEIKQSVKERFNEIVEKQLQNAETIIDMADAQVMAKIHHPDTTAVDAARIRQIYGGVMQNNAGFGGDGEDGEKTPKVINFINTFINIQKKDDRSKKRTTVEGTVVGDDKGGAKIGVGGTGKK